MLRERGHARMRRSCLATILIGLTLGPIRSHAWIAAEAQEKKLDIPDDASVKEAEKSIKSLFKDDYAKRAPADRQALAKNLLKQGVDTKDNPAARYVLFREAQDIAAKVGDIETAFKAIDEMSRTYVTNPITLKNGVLSLASGIPRTAEEQKVLVQAYIALAEEAAQARQFDVATKAAQSGLAAAKKIKDVPLLTKAEAQSKGMSSISDKYDKVKKAMEVLAAAPDNPEANQSVGEFECFMLGDWDAGLAKLAKATDPTLKSLAAKDLSKPAEGADQGLVGDGWWDRAEKESGQSKVNLRQRAAYWYGQAIQNLSGISKVKIEKRLAELKSDEGKIGTLRAVSRAGLVAWWKFDEGKGTAALNSAGSGNQATLNNGVEWTKGRLGNALKFSGKSYVSIKVTSLPATNASQTISWWHNYAANPSIPEVIMGLSDDAPTGFVTPGFKEGRIAVWKYLGAVLVSAKPPSTNAWHHFAYVFDSQRHSLYVDGKLEDSSTVPPQTATVTKCEIGRMWGGGGAEYFTGLLDDVRIYSRPLSEAEIQALAGGVE